MTGIIVTPFGIAHERGQRVGHPGGWMSAELTRLCDVEDLLDWLEMHGVTEKELHTESQSRFVVRWWQPEV